MADTPKIRVRGVHKSFGDNHVLKGVDLDIMNGESLALIGPSGMGKSVLGKCILGLMPVDQGTIEIDGKDVARISRREREGIYDKFGALFQAGALFDSLPVWRNVAFTLLSARNWTPEKAKKLAIERLADVGMEPLVADLFPAELSGGMQKRVAFARALAASPEVVVLDDPTAGLDPIVTAAISKLIDRIIKDTHATALIITQDMTVIGHVAHRVAMLYDGRIIWTGPTAEVKKSGNEMVDQFVHGRRQGPIPTDVVAAA